MSLLERRVGDLRPDIICITDLLEAYGKTITDVYDVIFQLLKGDTIIVDKKLTDVNTTIVIGADDNVEIHWVATDFDTIVAGDYKLAIGIKFDANEIEQNPDDYQIKNGANLGENPKYRIKEKATK